MMQKVWLLIVLVTLTVRCEAVTPQQINYQGYLTSPTGTPLDTTVNITFGLFNGPNFGATQLWTETQPLVIVQKGIYSVLLGSVAPFSASLFDSTNLWLGQAVGTDGEMSPRICLVSTAYSLRTHSVNGANGGTIGSDLDVAADLRCDTLRIDNVIQFPNGSFQSSAADTASLSNRINLKADSAGNATRVWVLSQGFVTNAQVYPDTNTWDATRAWVQSNGHLRGANNVVSATGFVGGGDYNMARGPRSVVAGGGGFSAIDSNSASGNSSTIGGGFHNTATGANSTISGGYRGIASGSTGATVSGGGNNTSSGDYATISGGELNEALSFSATVSGGDGNVASDEYATVGGGGANESAGQFSTIPGGAQNLANGNFSFAAGRLGRAINTASFVWGSSSSGDSTFSFDSYSVTFRCQNGARFYTDDNDLTHGVSLAPGGGSWASLSDSTSKRRRGKVNTADILQKVCALPIERWSYKAQQESIQHIGPMAQDFYNAFQVGDDDKSINTVDPDGVALAAIQELAKENAALRQQMQEQKTDLEARLQQLEARLQTHLAADQKADLNVKD